MVLTGESISQQGKDKANLTIHLTLTRVESPGQHSEKSTATLKYQNASHVRMLVMLMWWVSEHLAFQHGSHHRCYTERRLLLYVQCARIKHHISGNISKIGETRCDYIHTFKHENLFLIQRHKLSVGSLFYVLIYTYTPKSGWLNWISPSRTTVTRERVLLQQVAELQV